MTKITVGMFCDSFFPNVDGVAMVIDNYAKRLIKKMNVIVFVPSFKNKQIDDSIYPYKVVRCKSVKMPIIDYSLPTPDLDKTFKEELSKYKLDIVHIHSPFTMGRLGVKYAKDKNVPCIGTLHSQFKQDVKRALKFEGISDIVNKEIVSPFNKCDECWSVNQKIKQVFINEYGHKGNIYIIPNATDMKPVDKEKAKEYINKKYNLNDEYIFLFVGRLNKLKNIFLIVDSLKILKEKHKDFKFKMLFVGSGQDEEELKEYIKKQKMTKEIILTGKILDRNILAYHYARANLFLFPSLYDTSSLVQVEAASQKTPGLFIKGAVTAEKIKDNINGYLSENNKYAYEQKIEQIINDKNIEKVKENAYNDLYITWDDVADKVFNRYKYILERKNKNER